jgi:hypothetical protein
MIGSTIKNLLGWKTKRKIVVIESDDWGSIRMSSNEAIKKLTSYGANLSSSRYDLYDSLECNEDLEELFNVLISFKDANNKSPVFTGVNVVANPDFDKIKEGNFKQYYYEPFTETLKKYPQHDKVYDLWKKGINERLIVPQFHGREHLNVNRWMRALQAGSNGELKAFDLGVTGLSNITFPEEDSAGLICWPWYSGLYNLLSSVNSNNRNVGYGMCGGAIFKRQVFIDAYDKINEFNLEYLSQLDGRIIVAGDCLINCFLQYFGATYGLWDKLEDMTYPGWVEDDNTCFIHGYKNLYK